MIALAIGLVVGVERSYGQASVEPLVAESATEPAGERSAVAAAAEPIWFDEQGTREAILIDFGQVTVGTFVDSLVRFWYDQPGALSAPQLRNRDGFWTAFWNTRQLTDQQPGLSSDTFTIAFQSQRIGLHRDTLTFFDSVNGNRTIYLKAIGVTGSLRATPDPVEFDSVAIGECRTIPVTVTNIGLSQRTPVSVAGANGVTPFRVNSNFATIDSGESRTIFVVFCPTRAGEFHDTLVLGIDTSLRHIPLHGYGVPVLSVRPDSLSFDTVMVGHCVVDSIAVTNRSDTLVVDLEAVASRLSTPPQLTVTAMAGQRQLLPRQTAGLLITYCADGNSGALFTRELSYTIDTLTLLSCRVRAYPITPVVPAEDTLRIVASDTCEEKTIRIVNNSDYAIPLPRVAWSANVGPGFQSDPTVDGDVSVPPDAEFTVRYRFCRLAPGAASYADTLFLRSMDDRAIAAIAVRVLVEAIGQGNDTSATVSFGDVDTGKCGSQEIELFVRTNSADEAREIIEASLGDGAFSVDDVRTDNGTSLLVTFGFCPDTLGADERTIEFTIGTASFTLALSGNGVPVFAPRTIEETLYFNEVYIGTTARRAILISAIGQMIEVDAARTSFSVDPAPATVTVDPLPFIVSTNGADLLYFNYTPTTVDSLGTVWTGISTSGDTIRVRLIGKGRPRGIWLDSAEGRVGERITMRLIAYPPLAASEGVRRIEFNLIYDTNSFIIRNVRSPLTPRLLDQVAKDTLVVAVGDGSEALVGDILAVIELTGLTTGTTSNTLRIDPGSITGFGSPLAVIGDGHITLEGCDFGRDLKLTNKGSILAVTGDASGREFTLRYRAPVGSHPQVRIVALDGAEKMRITLPEGDESEQSARVLPEDLAPGLYLLELRAGSDRAATLFMVGG